MAGLFTIDSSVFVAARRTQEDMSAVSRDLIQRVRKAGIPLVEPTILPVEIAAALTRTGEEPTWAAEYAERVMAFPHLTLWPLDEYAVRRAVKTAVQCRLRGADALYVAAAAQYGARLVTLDTEQLERAPADVRACQPEAASELLRNEETP